MKFSRRRLLGVLGAATAASATAQLPLPETVSAAAPTTETKVIERVVEKVVTDAVVIDPLAQARSQLIAMFQQGLISRADYEALYTDGQSLISLETIAAVNDVMLKGHEVVLPEQMCSDAGCAMQRINGYPFCGVHMYMDKPFFGRAPLGAERFLESTKLRWKSPTWDPGRQTTFADWDKGVAQGRARA